MTAAAPLEPAAVGAGLHDFLREVGLPGASDIVVSDLGRITSVGNAREPWSFTARWRDGSGQRQEQRAVMLVKAEAGQLEVNLAAEFGVLAGLGGSGVPAPAALWLDESGDWIGRPFFATEWVPGRADTRPLRRDDDPDVRAVAVDLARAAAKLHGVDWAAAGIDCLAVVAPADAATSQLAYWEDLFLRQRLEPHPALVYAFAWLSRRPPVAERVGIVHGDLRFGNLLADQGRLTTLLDWEMVHLGDPVEDLGWVYRSLWSPARSLPFEEFLDAYGEAAGPPVDPERLRWWQLFSEVKHSVISLTAARSFHDGRTPNLRMADRAATVANFMTRFLELLPC